MAREQKAGPAPVLAPDTCQDGASELHGRGHLTSLSSHRPPGRPSGTGPGGTLSFHNWRLGPSIPETENSSSVSIFFILIFRLAPKLVLFYSF